MELHLILYQFLELLQTLAGGVDFKLDCHWARSSERARFTVPAVPHRTGAKQEYRLLQSPK